MQVQLAIVLTSLFFLGIICWSLVGSTSRSMLSLYKHNPLVDAPDNQKQIKNRIAKFENHVQSIKYTILWSFLAITGGCLLLLFLVYASTTQYLQNELYHLREQLQFTLPQLANRSNNHEELTDPFVGLQMDIQLLLNRIEEQKQNELFKEQLDRWQDIARRLAHEIKNPLTPILLAIQQLHQKYSGEDKNYKGILDMSQEIVREEIETLRRLVEEFSSFAKLPKVVPEREDLRKVVKEFLNAYDWFEGKADIELMCGETPIWVQLDKMLFKRVLHNLIQNAIEAGSTQLIIRCSILATQKILCQIEDNGPGIPEHLQSKIFTPYFTTKDFGTGLGLSITKKLIIDHGGRINLGSNLKGGATFSILLPKPRPVPEKES